MNPTVKNILAVIAGIVIGSAINMGIIMFSGNIIPLPEGVDPSDGDSIKQAMEAGLFETKHYIFPFLAHALGTFIGAIIAATIATTRKPRFALAIGVWFLIGGIANNFMLPAPVEFEIFDSIFAYLPMGFLAGKLVRS